MTHLRPMAMAAAVALVTALQIARWVISACNATRSDLLLSIRHYPVPPKTLSCIAITFTVGNHIASYCIILYHIVSYYIILYHIILYCIALYYIVVYYIILYT